MFREAHEAVPLAPFFAGLIGIVNFALDIYIWILIARVFMSWLTPNPYHPLVRTINRLTEPVLLPIRRRLPGGRSLGIDFSPLVAIFAISLLQLLLISLGRQL
jgi:YggT family protein